MSNLPSIRLVSWNTEFGVGVIFPATWLAANSPFSWATQIGQLKPPGKTISSIGLSWARTGAATSAASAMTHAASGRSIDILPSVVGASGDRVGLTDAGDHRRIQQEFIGERAIGGGPADLVESFGAHGGIALLEQALVADRGRL